MREITSPWIRERRCFDDGPGSRRRPLPGRQRTSTPEVIVLGKREAIVFTQQQVTVGDIKRKCISFYYHGLSLNGLRLLQWPRPLPSSCPRPPEALPSSVYMARNHHVCIPDSGRGQAEERACCFLQRAQLRSCTPYFCSHPTAQNVAAKEAGKCS